jgi:outer membrane biosynthesis protein TonB
MASFALSPDEQKRKRTAYIVSSTVTGIILILMILKFFHYPDPPPPPEGILVNLGLPDQGQGEENTPGPLAPTPAPEKPQPEKPQPEIKETKPVTKPTTTPVVKDKPVVTTEDPNAVAIKERQEKERREKAEADRVAREQAEARQRAEEERQRKEAEAKATKDQIGGLFGGGGKGSGKGNTGKPGNQGDPNGDPNAKNLEGITTGTGSVGGSLGNRNVLSAPRITDNSSLEGTVVIAVCVDANGSVVSADFTQKGSTTSNSTLVNLAVNNAKKWKFSAGEVDKQCGTVTYRFKVQ